MILLLMLCVAGVGGLSSPGERTRRCVVLSTSFLAQAMIAPCGAASLVDTSYSFREERSRVFLESILPPILNRATALYDLGRGAYGLEQLLAFTNVSATVRANVVRLKDGSLFVFAPVAPTEECLALLKDIGGPVSHIALPVTALEHKAFFGPFVRNFPNAKVWVAPGQYGPFGSMDSLPYRVDGVLDGTVLEGFPYDEVEYKLFYANLKGNAGPVSEVAFFHRPTTTLIATDAVVWIPEKPSPLFETLFDKDTMQSPDFWPKTVLQSVFVSLRQAPETNSFPAYDLLKSKLIRAPILRAFNDVRAPNQTRKWVDAIATDFDFDRILTSHFASPIMATPQDFRRAFARLDGPDAPGVIKLDDQDWESLDSLNDLIETQNLGAPIVATYK